MEESRGRSDSFVRDEWRRSIMKVRSDDDRRTDRRGMSDTIAGTEVGASPMPSSQFGAGSCSGNQKGAALASQRRYVEATLSPTRQSGGILCRQ